MTAKERAVLIMPMFYLPEGQDNLSNLSGLYSFSYQELRDDYRRFYLMSDDEFLGNLLDILHFTVYVSYIKEGQARWLLADNGIIHELVHLLMEERNRAHGYDKPRVTDTSLEKIRDLFNRDCCLA